MKDYNSMDKEPEYKSLRNKLKDKLYSEKGNAVGGTLNLLVGTGLLAASILGEDKTTLTSVESAAAAVFYLCAGLQYGFYRKNKD